MVCARAEERIGGGGRMWDSVEGGWHTVGYEALLMGGRMAGQCGCGLEWGVNGRDVAVLLCQWCCTDRPPDRPG